MINLLEKRRVTTIPTPKVVSDDVSVICNNLHKLCDYLMIVFDRNVSRLVKMATPISDVIKLRHNSIYVEADFTDRVVFNTVNNLLSGSYRLCDHFDNVFVSLGVNSQSEDCRVVRIADSSPGLTEYFNQFNLMLNDIMISNYFTKYTFSNTYPYNSYPRLHITLSDDHQSYIITRIENIIKYNIDPKYVSYDYDDNAIVLASRGSVVEHKYYSGNLRDVLNSI